MRTNKITVNLFSIVAIVIMITIILGVTGLVDWWTILLVALWHIKLDSFIQSMDYSQL